jgi:hypothetical protein
MLSIGYFRLLTSFTFRIYAFIEQQAQQMPDTITSITNSSDPTPLDFRSSRSKADPNESKDGPMLSLRLRASSLVHTHSIHSRVSPSTVSKPDTYFEISRPSSSDWIVVYRSPTVKESTSPTWDEAIIYLDSLYSKSQLSQSSDADANPDFTEYRVVITVYKVKKKKCKAIGSLETTVQALINASLVLKAETTNELQSVSITETKNPGTFKLQTNYSGGGATKQEITGYIDVLEAHVGYDQQENSQRFLSSDSYDECSTITSMEIDAEPTNAALRVIGLPTAPKFVDYVNAGLDIDFCVAIDFVRAS